jgi:hypothetical protein
MWIIIILMILFLISTCALSYACYNMIKKIEMYESWVSEFGNEVNQMYSKIKSVDDRNLFEKDDDVGGTFADILKITKEFNDRFG